MKNKIPELVLPGGDLHRVETAFRYGADTVYVGLDKYSLRKAEVRFTIAGIGKAIKLAHDQGKKIYVTFNIFAHNKHLKNIREDMAKIAAFKPDAFIISDPGIIEIAREVARNVPIHLSTQANTLSSSAVLFWKKQGVKRVVLGREATLEEIKQIKKDVPGMELEVFVHGAMCISYSGRCLMSAALTGRSANLGSCTQPCRWEYDLYLEEKSRPGEFMKMEEATDGSYLMSSKDLCLIEYLDELAKAGVDALKVEGRNKTDYYVATVARAYRTGLDLLAEGKYDTKAKTKLRNEVQALTRRDYTSGFLFGKAKEGETFPGRQPVLGKKYLGYISAYHKDNWSTVVVKNKLEVNKQYELLAPEGVLEFEIEKMKDKSTGITDINPGTKDKKVLVKTTVPLACGSFIRAIK